jgi:hypothetical protein
VSVGRGGMVGVGRGVWLGISIWVGGGGDGVTRAQATLASKRTTRQVRKRDFMGTNRKYPRYSAGQES